MSGGVTDATGFLRWAYDAGDWIAVFLKAADSGRTAQRVGPVTMFCEPRWQIWMRVMQIYRFKGLGEMDAKELFETTMNPSKRKLLRIDLTDAIEAEEMFTRLMGDEVEPRKQFIEDNALNVRNLDV